MWDRLDELSEKDLAILTAATVSILAEQPTADKPVRDLPPSKLAEELVSILADSGLAAPKSIARQLATEPAPRELLIPILTAIGAQHGLAQQIMDAYEAQKQMMIIDAGLVSAAALLILVLKLRKVRIANKVEIDFYQVTSSVLNALRQFMGRP